MKTSCDFIQAFGYAMANRINVTSFSARLSLLQTWSRGRDAAVKTRQIAIKPRDYQMRRGRSPFDGAKKNSRAFGSELYGRRDTCLRLSGIFDGGRQNGVFYNSDDHSAGREICDNFIGRCVLSLLGSDRPRNK